MGGGASEFNNFVIVIYDNSLEANIGNNTASFVGVNDLNFW